MCQKCVDALNEHWPGLSDKDRNDLLWGATSFPFGDADMVAKQLEDLSGRTEQNLEMALAIADSEMDAAMEKMCCDRGGGLYDD